LLALRWKILQGVEENPTGKSFKLQWEIQCVLAQFLMMRRGDFEFLLEILLKKGSSLLEILTHPVIH
jgi:hypothetical protein